MSLGVCRGCTRLLSVCELLVSRHAAGKAGLTTWPLNNLNPRSTALTPGKGRACASQVAAVAVVVHALGQLHDAADPFGPTPAPSGHAELALLHADGAGTLARGDPCMRGEGSRTVHTAGRAGSDCCAFLLMILNKPSTAADQPEPANCSCMEPHCWRNVDPRW